MSEARAKDNLYGFSSYPPSFDTEPPPFSDSDDGEDNSFDDFVSASNPEFGYTFPPNAADELKEEEEEVLPSADRIGRSTNSDHCIINGEAISSNIEEEKADNDSGWADFGAFESHAETSTSERPQGDVVQQHSGPPGENSLLAKGWTNIDFMFDNGIPNKSISTNKSSKEADDCEIGAESTETVILAESVDRNCTNLISEKDKFRLNNDNISASQTEGEVLCNRENKEEVSGDNNFGLLKEANRNMNLSQPQSSENGQSFFDHRGQEDDLSASLPEVRGNGIVNIPREGKATSHPSNLDSTSISLHEAVYNGDVVIRRSSGERNLGSRVFDRTEKNEDYRKDIPLSLDIAEEDTNREMYKHHENIPVKDSPNNHPLGDITAAEDYECKLSNELDEEFDDWASFESARPAGLNIDSNGSSLNVGKEEKSVDCCCKAPDHVSTASSVDVQNSCTVDSEKDSDDWASFTYAEEDTYNESVTKNTTSAVSNEDHSSKICIDTSTKGKHNASLNVPGSEVTNESNEYSTLGDSDKQQRHVHDQAFSTVSITANDEYQWASVPNFSMVNSDSGRFGPLHSQGSFETMSKESSRYIEHIDVPKEQVVVDNSSDSKETSFINDNSNLSGVDDDFDEWASFDEFGSATTVDHFVNENVGPKQGSSLISDGDHHITAEGPYPDMRNTSSNEGVSKGVVEKAVVAKSSSKDSNGDDDWASFSSFESHDTVGVIGASVIKSSSLNTDDPDDSVMGKERDERKVVEPSHNENGSKDDDSWATFTSCSDGEPNETDVIFSKADKEVSDLEHSVPSSNIINSGKRSTEQMCFEQPEIKLPLGLCFGAPKKAEDLPHKKTRRKSLRLESVIHDKYLQGEQSIWIQLKEAANRETSFKVIYNASIGLRWMLPTMDVAFENMLPRKTHKKSSSLVTPQTLSPTSSVGSFDFSDPILEPTPALLADITTRPDVGRQTLLLQSQLKDDKGPPVQRVASSSSLKKDSGSENTSETTSLDLEFFSSGGMHPVVGNLTQSKSDQQLSALDLDLLGVNFDMQSDTKAEDETTNSSGKGKEQESGISGICMGDGPQVSAKAPSKVNSDNSRSGAISSLAANFLEDLGSLNYMTSSVLMFPSKLLQDG